MPAAAKPVYLVGGSDEFAIKEHAAKLAAKLAPKDAGEFGVEIIEGDAGNADDALRVIRRLREALFTVGLFGGDKVVWLKSTNLLAAQPPGGESTTDALNTLNDDLKRGLPAGVTLLVSAIGFDKRRSIAKTLEKTGEAFFFDAPEAGKQAGEEQITEFIGERLAAEKKRFADPDAMGAFRELVAPTMRELANELEKLCIYVGKRPEITEADVRAICSATRGVDDFELANLIGLRNLPGCIRTVEKMLNDGDEPIAIVMQLAGQFRLMLLAHDLVERKILRRTDYYAGYAKAFAAMAESEKAHMPRSKDGRPPNEWRFGRCAMAAHNFSRAEIIRAMDLLLEAHIQLVSTQLDGKLVIEETITKIARKQETP